jgi:Bacteriophage HK97-gp10, putative tail-component
MSIEITKDTLTPTLNNLPSLIQKKGVKAVQGGLEVFRNGAVENAPVITGRLKGSLQSGSKEGIYKVEETSESVIGTLGTNVEYAKRIEFGFVGADKAGRKINQKGTFFLTRALTQNMDKIRTVIYNILKL